MKVIDQKSWSWTLYQHNDEYILSVLCGTVAMYGREVVLNEDEKTEYLQHGINSIAKRIANNPSLYKTRQIVDFHDDTAVKDADIEWRASKES